MFFYLLFFVLLIYSTVSFISDVLRRSEYYHKSFTKTNVHPLYFNIMKWTIYVLNRSFKNNNQLKSLKCENSLFVLHILNTGMCSYLLAHITYDEKEKSVTTKAYPYSYIHDVILHLQDNDNIFDYLVATNLNRWDRSELKNCDIKIH